jgi:ATP/maltotriose-dependent transcriptional regulator MalT
VFRYHPLLRSVLLRDLRRRGPGRAEQLHRIAARWYAERGQVSAAIRHAHAGRDRSHTDTLVRRHWFVGLLGRERSTIDAALTALRRAWTPVDTELAAIIAAYRAAAGDWTEAADWLARARRLAEADGDALGHRERLALASARLIVAHAPAGVAERAPPPGVPEAGGEGPVEPLSERELGVLRLLPTHLTAEEIADELSLSVNTVKTHMRSLYAKLGVHRRADAVAQARALGVLDFW